MEGACLFSACFKADTVVVWAARCVVQSGYKRQRSTVKYRRVDSSHRIRTVHTQRHAGHPSVFRHRRPLTVTCLTAPSHWHRHRHRHRAAQRYHRDTASHPATPRQLDIRSDTVHLVPSGPRVLQPRQNPNINRTSKATLSAARYSQQHAEFAVF